MINRKINLDRARISSEEIQARQNFDDVLSKFQAIKTPIWKSPWFWGSTGLASVATAIVIGLSHAQSNPPANEKTTTLTQNELPADTECIKPPVKGEDIPFTSYWVNSQKEQVITTPEGSVIHIPAESLQPNNPDQRVEIRVREFRDKASVFVAGVKMDVFKREAFESAGMIELRGVQAGAEVAINPSKPIAVELQLIQDPAGFDFWKMNETKGEWEPYAATYQNQAVGQSEQPGSSSKQIKKEVATIDHRLSVVSQALDNLSEPSPVAYKIPQPNHQKFDLGFDPGQYPELAGFKDVIFEVVPTTGYDKKFASKTWKDARLEKVSSGYQMVLSGTNERLVLPVRPVLQGAELAAAEQKWDAAIAEYTSEKQRLTSEKRQLEERKRSLNTALLDALKESEATANRSTESSDVRTQLAVQQARSSVGVYQQTARFSTTTWGLFNSDKPISYPMPLENEPFFAWENGSEMKVVSLYTFDLDKNTRYSFGTGARFSLQNFGLFKRNETVVIAIDAEGNLGSCVVAKTEDGTKWQKFSFVRKDTEEKTVDWLKKMMHEMDAA